MGRRYYTCTVCGVKTMFRKCERYRVKRLSCKGCGSIWLIPTSKEGRVEEIETSQNIIEAPPVLNKSLKDTPTDYKRYR